MELSPEAETCVRASRDLVERVAAGDAPAYGINTGFGTLAEVRIDKKDLSELQRNLILSHAAGVGTPMSLLEARALLLLRCNVLAKGFSGIRLETLKLALDMLNKDVVPVVPERGSVGASGDWRRWRTGARLHRRGRGASTRASACPLVKRWSAPASSPWCSRPRRAALVNGTQAMCAVGTLLQLRAESLALVADIAGSMTLEGLLGSHKPFLPEIQDVRPHEGQKAVAAHLLRLLAGSDLVETHVNCSKVQDPYSLRCMPQVHGAAREGLAFGRRILEVEVNSATDNPLVFVDTGRIISGGNFHGQPISLAMDVTAMALTQLSSISERRVEQLVNPALSNLPPFLAKNPGLNSGFMIAQVTSAALVAESRVLCHPASVDSIPSSAGREDHVSMGMTAALKGRQVADFTRTCLAIELLVASQALDYRLPVKAGRGPRAAHELVRSRVPTMEKDREIHRDIEAVCELIDSGLLLQTVRHATA
ncbi:histidine ammonia-lyase [Cystobacter fuscus]